MSLFNKQNKEALINPLNLDHPILVQALGVCSALAVTSQLKPAIVGGIGSDGYYRFCQYYHFYYPQYDTYAYSYCRNNSLVVVAAYRQRLSARYSRPLPTM